MLANLGPFADLAKTAAARKGTPGLPRVPEPCQSEPEPSAPVTTGTLSLPGLNALNGLINSAAGYDDRVLSKYGTPTDEKRRRNIGRAIVVATAVGSLGWFTKILMTFPGWLAVPVALTVAILYAVLSYSLESFFSANVDPFASVMGKLVSLIGRSMLSAIIAFAGALPWVTMSLKASVNVEMSKMALAEKAALRGEVDQAHGLKALSRKAESLQAETQAWTTALTTLPPTIQASLEQAQACAIDLDRLQESGAKKAAILKSRLGLLAKIEGAPNATATTARAVAVERGQIQSSLARQGQETASKKAECAELKSTAESARSAHVNLATEERSASAKRLAALRATESAVDEKVKVDLAKVDQLLKEGGQANSSAEFAALLRVVETQLFAQLLAGLIFIGLFLVDLLPLTLRLFSRPGPYDAEKRADDAIKNMHAEGRLLEAKMMHEARKAEMESKDLQTQVRVDCRPHIRSIILNGVGSFLQKQSRGHLTSV